MKQVEDSLTVLTETRLWINLVGDSKGFEGETAEDERILMSLMKKSSFTWEEEGKLQREANSHGYGISLIIFNKAEWKESYQDSYRDRGIRTKDRKNRTLKLRRKAA